MGDVKLKIIQSKNIFSDDVNMYLRDQMELNPNFIYIAATNSILDERKKSDDLSFYFQEKERIYYSNSFEFCINSTIRSSKGYLSLVDMYYILKKLIEYYFRKSDIQRSVYQKTSYHLFELYKLLIFNNVDYVSDQEMNYIKSNYPDYCVFLFDIYNEFRDIINKLINDVNGEYKNHIDYNIYKLNINLSIQRSDKVEFKHFIDRKKMQLQDVLNGVDTLYLDGFVAFDDWDKYIISVARSLCKRVVFISKDIQGEYKGEFLFDNVYEIGSTLDKNKILIESYNEDECTPSIKYIRNNLYRLGIPDKKESMSDGGINFIEPFLNRGDEILYIAQTISELIRNKYEDDNDIIEIRRFIENDILIVCSVNKDIMTELLDDQFSKTGFFVFVQVPEEISEKVNLDSFKRIYYNSRDFLMNDVLYEDGTKLNNYDKLIFFKKGFLRIRLPSKPKPILASPILEFIFELYEILDEGMTPKRFKAILFSNWYYHTGRSDIKWDSFLGAFNQIQGEFQRISLIKDWQTGFEDIIAKRDKICDNYKYIRHPFNSISREELVGLLSIIKEIRALLDALSSIHGEMRSHIRFLKDKIIYTDRLSDIDDDLLTDAQRVIKDFCGVLDDIVLDSSVMDMDSLFFSKHLKNIISNLNLPVLSYKDDFTLQIQSMLNMKHYKYVFFMGLEDSKYPRKHERRFPFTQEIVDIIKRLGVSSYGIDIYDHNITMEKIFFKNVLDFTETSIWFTCTQYDGKHNNKFAIYVENIATAFNQDVEYKIPLRKQIDISIKKDINALAAIYPEPKVEYTLKELITYQLCPKLYYHLYLKPKPIAYKSEGQFKMYAEAVLYCDLFDRFMKYNNKSNDKEGEWYNSSEDKYYNVLKKLSSEGFKENCENFSSIWIPDMDEIKDKALSRILRFIEKYVIDDLGYDKYTLVKANEIIYPCGEFNLRLECDMVVFSNTKGIRQFFQNNTFLDFLALKCTSKKTSERHYKEMKRLLNTGSRYIDRLFFANKMINKINVQFASKIKSFIAGNDGGIERVKNLRNEIINTDFSRVLPVTSNFCSYNNKDISFNNIVIISFTNKATDEMKQRISRGLYKRSLIHYKNGDIELSKRLEQESYLVNITNISTIHSFCESLIRTYGLNINCTPNYKISSYSEKIISLISSKLVRVFSKNKIHELPNSMLRELMIEVYKCNNNRGIYEINDSYQKFITSLGTMKSKFISLYNEIVSEIEVQKLNEGTLCPNDLIEKACNLLQNKYVCNRVLNQYKYIFIDEYQDTNDQQFRLTKIFIEMGIKVFLVGDEKQAIYNFRGSDIKNSVKMSRYIRSYNSENISLLENFRSDPLMIDKINKIFSSKFYYNYKNIPFENSPLLIPNKEAPSEDNPIRILYEENIIPLIKRIVSEMTIRGQKIGYGDIAILCRKNYMVDELGSACKLAGIPAEVVGGQGFYKAKGVQDIYKIFNYIVYKRQEYKDELIFTDVYAAFLRYRDGNFDEFLNGLCENAKNNSTEMVIEYIIENTGLNQYYLDNNRYQEISNLLKLKALAYGNDSSGYMPAFGFLDFIESKMTKGAQEDEARISDENRKKGVVSIYTVHKAKGLSFPVVIISNVDNGLINPKRFPRVIMKCENGKTTLGFSDNIIKYEDPQYKNLLEQYKLETLEEELRVLYVACTRAKNILILCCNKPKYSILNSKDISWAKWILDTGVIE